MRNVPPTRQNASKQFLRSHLVHGQPAIVASVIAGAGGTLGLLLQTFAIARSVQLVVIERAPLPLIYPWLLLFIGTIVFRSLCTYLSSRWSAAGALEIQTTVRRAVIDMLFSPSSKDAHADTINALEPQAAETAHTLLEQIDLLEPYYAHYVPQSILSVISPLLILAIIFYKNWIVGLDLLLAAPIIPFNMIIVGMNAQDISMKQMAKVRELSSVFLDYVQGMTTLKGLGYAERAIKRVAAAAQELGQRSMSVQSVALLSSAALELVSTFAIAIAAAYIGCNLLRYILFGTGPTGMSLQTGLFLLLLAPAFFQPLRSFAAAYHDRADALAAVESLLPILSSSSENLSTPEESEQAVQELADVQSIELRQLSVHYTGQKNPTLQEVTLPLIRDQAIALTGESGSGKSTLLGVLAGYIQAASGDMLVNGEVLPPQTSVKTSWIGQRPYLFPGTLAENIALGQTERTSEEIEIAARKAGVMSFAEKFPAGLDTQVGERGLGLSGGEAQRVALARAFLKNAPLLLLDEPTAHVDTETEEQLLASLAELVKGKFVVIATHSPTVLTICKQIYHSEAGKLEQVSIPEEEASRA